MKGGGLVITGPESISLFRLLSLKGALKLEMLGMTHSRGSVYALVKAEFGLKGNKQAVYDQFVKIVEAAGEAQLARNAAAKEAPANG